MQVNPCCQILMQMKFCYFAGTELFLLILLALFSSGGRFHVYRRRLYKRYELLILFWHPILQYFGHLYGNYMKSLLKEKAKVLPQALRRRFFFFTAMGLWIWHGAIHTCNIQLRLNTYYNTCIYHKLASNQYLSCFKLIK